MEGERHGIANDECIIVFTYRRYGRKLGDDSMVQSVSGGNNAVSYDMIINIRTWISRY